MATEWGLPKPEADRIAQLLERGTALALALEQLEHAGTWTITGAGERYPRRLLTRLGDAAPPVLHGVGDLHTLDRAGIGVVGSRDVDADGATLARDVARIATDANLPVVSGAARGVDQHAMNAAVEYGGRVVGVLADSLDRSVKKASTRQAIARGRVCLLTPYAPSAGFTTATAMGRNKIIYGLARAVVVVRSDEGTGGTWAGATEALRHKWSTVVSWVGPGSGEGNHALVKRGAVPLQDVSQLATALTENSSGGEAPNDRASSDQLSLPI